MSMKTKLCSLLVILMFLSTSIFSQEVEVFGIVSNLAKEPIHNVQVSAVKKNIKVYTNSNGLYSIRVEPNEILTFSVEGYEDQKVTLNPILRRRPGERLEVNITLNIRFDPFSLSLEDLMRVEVVSVSKKVEKLNETPQTVIVLTAEDIRIRGYSDIEQLFHDLPGFDISRGYGTEYSQIYQRGYRSNNTDRTLFLIDGVEENDLWSGSTWIGRQFPLNNIERVEVVYGPATTIYGPNAFVGAVNIVTKDVSIIEPEKHIGVSSHIGYGSWNTFFTDLHLAAKKSKVSLSLTGRIYQSEEMDLSKYEDWDYSFAPYTVDYYKQILGTDNNEIATLARNLDEQGYFHSQSLEGKVPKYSNSTYNHYLYGKLGFSNLTLGFESFKRRDGYGAWYRDEFELGPAHGCFWTPKNSFFYAKYQESISDKISVTSLSSFRWHTIDGESNEMYFYGYLNGEFNISGLVDDDGNILPESEQKTPFWWKGYYHTYSSQLRTELRVEHEISNRLNVIYGTEYRNNRIQGDYLFSELKFPEETAFANQIPGGNHFYSNDLGLFTQANYQHNEKLIFVLGGRFDHNRIRKTGGYGAVFNPKFATIYTHKSLIFKFIYSEAFKDADFWTKYGTTPGRLLNNPSLPPEKVRNLDLSASWHLLSSLYLDISGFYALYDGVVGTADVTFIDNDGSIVHTTQHQAFGSLKISGIQSNIAIRWENYSGYLNYTFTNPYNTTETNNVRIGDIASHQVNVGVNATYWKKTTFNLRSNWVGRKETGQTTTISSNPYNFINPYVVFNGAITHKVWKGVSAQVSIFNIFDAEYFHPGVRSANGTYYASRLPQYERHLFAKLMVDF